MVSNETVKMSILQYVFDSINTHFPAVPVVPVLGTLLSLYLSYTWTLRWAMGTHLHTHLYGFSLSLSPFSLIFLLFTLGNNDFLVDYCIPNGHFSWYDKVAEIWGPWLEGKGMSHSKLPCHLMLLGPF